MSKVQMLKISENSEFTPTPNESKRQGRKSGASSHLVWGFTLIEIMIVSFLVAVMSTFIILTFRNDTTNQASRIRAAKAIISDIRRAQQLSISTTSYDGQITCGYGVHKVDNDTYLIYAGLSGGVTCETKPKNYQAGIDAIVEIRKITNPELEIRNNFKDIFFKPPDPLVYFQNVYNINAQPEEIRIINKTGNNCNTSPCTIVKVHVSGKMEIVP